MESTKDLNYYKNNCEEDYVNTPISVLRYITELEQALQLQQGGVSGSKCSRKCKECNKLVFDCSDFCSKRCETTYYR